MTSLFIALALVAAAGPGALADAAQAGAPARPQGPAVPAASTADPGPAGGAYHEFLLGLHLETMGDLSGALAAFERAERLDPSSAEIPAALAELYARQDRSADAVAAAERAIKADPKNPEANWVMGRIYAAMSEAAGSRDPVNTDYAARAVPYLERADPIAHPAVRLALARLYLRTRNFTKAASLLAAYVAEQPDEAEAIGLLAEAYQGAGRPEEAIALLERVAQDAPELYGNLGQMYEGRQRWDEAAKAYGEAVRFRPRSLTLRLRWARALLNTDSSDDARRARGVLEEVTAQSPTNVEVLYLLSQAERRTSDLAAAAATARRIVAIDPSGLIGPFVLAQVLQEQGEYRQAVDTLEPVLAKSRNGGEAPAGIDPARLWAQLGAARLQLREFGPAVDSFMQARRLSPDDPAMDVLVVQALITAGRTREAIETVQRAREQYPRDLRLARLQARAFRLDGRVDEAIAVMRAAVGADAANPLAYIGLAEVYTDLHRPSEAIGVLQDAATRFPRETSIRFQLGAVFERQKRYADAERVFRQVIAEDPEHSDALNYLGYMLAERGERLQESVELVQRALALDPGNAAYLDSLGWAYFKLNRLDLALDPLRDASARMRTSSVVQSHFGDLLFKRGQYREAIEAWERALAGDGEAVSRGDIEKKIRNARRKLGKT